MEIKFRAKRAAFNMTVTTPPLIVDDEFMMQDKKGVYRNCDGNTFEIVIDGQAIKAVEIKKLMILRAEIRYLIELVTSDRNDADVVRDIINFMNNLEDKSND